MKIISALLGIVTLYFSIKHGWAGINAALKPEDTKLMAGLGISRSLLFIMCAFTLSVAVLILFPQTFFMANFINAAILMLMLCLQLRAGNLKAAGIELLFLMLPFVLIWLGHPLKNNS